MSRIAIVDYGLGNLFNVERALTALDVDPLITSDPAALDTVDGILLPGVGAFGEGIRNLEAGGLADAIREHAGAGKPTLGICLGMQLLMDDSEEYGRWAGLGLVPGRVVRIAPSVGERTKVPQIGWNTIDGRPEADVTHWQGTILEGLGPKPFAYFVHSYCVEVADPNDSLAVTTYGGTTFDSVIARDNVMGCQFHPEKSAEVGLVVLRNWLRYGVDSR